MAAWTNQMCWKQHCRAVTAAGTPWYIKTAWKTEEKWKPVLPVWIYFGQLFYPFPFLLHLSKWTQNSPSLMIFLPSPLMTPNWWPFHASISLCSISSELALFHLFALCPQLGFHIPASTRACRHCWADGRAASCTALLLSCGILLLYKAVALSISAVDVKTRPRVK